MASSSIKFSQRLRAAREKKGWSRVELCRQANIASTTLRYLENGLSDPSSVILSKLAKAFGISIDDLVDNSDESIRIKLDWREHHQEFETLNEIDRQIIRTQFDITRKKLKSKIKKKGMT